MTLRYVYSPPPPKESKCWAYIEELRPSLEHLDHLPLIILGRQDHVILELQRRLVVALERDKIDHQIGLDGKDCVRLQPRVVLGVQLGRAALVVVVGDLVGQSQQVKSRRMGFEKKRGVALLKRAELTMMWMCAGRIG